MDYCKDGDLRNYQKINWKNQKEDEKIEIILQLLNGLEHVFFIFIFINIRFIHIK
jgi:hypothetical protein